MDRSKTDLARNPSDPVSGPSKPRAYYLLCLCCGSRLEVTLAQAGQAAKCPTCGVGFEIPATKAMIESVGGCVSVGEPPEERMAVHAYAAAGAMAPEVVADRHGRDVIRCRRCGTANSIEVDSCRSCRIPFTIEAGTGVSDQAMSGWTMGALILGVLSLVTFPVPILGIAAIVVGLVAVKSLYVQYNGVQRLVAWSGIILGALSIVACLAWYISSLW